MAAGIPDNFVPNKGRIAHLASVLRDGAWVNLDNLFFTVGGDHKEIRMAVDVLHYCGVIRSYSDTNGLWYQWIK